jgi:hypothetical protein
MNLKFNITLFYPSPPKYSQNWLSILFFLFKISEKKNRKKGKMKPIQNCEAATDMVEMKEASIFFRLNWTIFIF